MRMKAPSASGTSDHKNWIAATDIAKKMYETERETLDLVMPWERLSTDKREARILAVLAHMFIPDSDRIDQLVEQVREQRGDYLTALEDLADHARGMY